MLQFIGTGAAFNPYFGGNTSAFWKDGKGGMLLIDCGETVFHRILTLRLLDDVKKLTICITHLHPDHAGSLGSLIFYCRFIRNIDVGIYSKDGIGLDVSRYLNFCGVDSSLYRLIGDSHYVWGCYVVHHVDNLISYMYVFNFGDEVCIYTGDTDDIWRVVYVYNLYKEVFDNITVYVDCTLNKGTPHMYLSALSKNISKEERQNFVCMHFDDKYAKNGALTCGFRVAEPIEI